MRFLERNLEDIIYGEPELCFSRGLDFEGDVSGTFRQVDLHPYGIADLIQVGFDHANYKFFVRIIECKRDIVNLATYGQAARYQSAIERVVGNKGVIFQKVLIGRRIESNDDLHFVLEADPWAIAMTYEYLGDGIHFKPWNHTIATKGKYHKPMRPYMQEYLDKLFNIFDRHANGAAK